MRKKLKIITIIGILIILLCSFMPTIVYGEGIEGDEVKTEDLYIYSKKEDGTIKITGVTEEFYNYYEGEERLILPEMLDGSYVTSVLMRLNVLTTIKEIKIPDKVESIGSHLFEDCTALESVILPSKIKAIGENAFYNCSNLKQIKIPDEVTLIGDLAFAECTSLKKVELPENVQRIGENVFQNCTGLEEIKINNKVTVIKDNAFTGCTSLREIEIPKSVTKIKVNAFKDCTSLTKVTIKNSSITLENNIFEGVPRVSLASYKNSTSSVYAEGYENINFEEIASEISQVEKAGWLMSAFANECATTYSNKFYYTESHPGRETYVFNYQNEEVGNSTLTLDCVGNLNLFIYQTTGLWSKNFAINNDPTYLTPQSGLKADDVFESEGYIQAKTFYNIAGAITEGKLHVGDLIQLDGHVAMYTGISSDGMVLCPENYSEHPSMTYKNFISGSPSVWASAGNIYRIKEEAANELTFLYELNTKEEVEAYGRKLAEAYMQGEAEYKGETLKRKNYGINKVTVGNKTEPVIGTETIDNVEIKTIKNIKGYTVKDIKALEMFAGYSKVEVLDEEGKVITNENEKMISTAMKVRLYKDITTGQALEIRAGGDTLQEEYVVIIYGDVTGTGKPSAIDALAIVKNATGKIKFNNKIKEIAGRVSKEARKNKTRPTAVDALMIVQEKLGKIEINQGEFTEQEPEVDETSDIIPIYTRADLEKVGSGEEWLVESVGKIYTMKTDAKYVLMKDIDLSEKAWTPIGLPEVKNEAGEVIKESTILTNTFEGNNHKITGMTITGEQTSKEIGLFAVTSANIKHLKLENAKINNITFTEDASTVLDEKQSKFDCGTGILVGCLLSDNNIESEKIVINNCEISGETSEDYVSGGIVGKIYGVNATVFIENCINNVNLTGAGIAKNVESNINIINCKNNGSINGAGFILILKNSNIIVANSTNNGDTGSINMVENIYLQYSSGFIDIMDNVNISIISCINNGKITNGSGFIQNANDDNLSYVKINKCTNAGEIVRTDGGYYAGICGNMHSVKEIIILNSTNTGNVQGYAGILCYTPASLIQIENCDNYGNIITTSGTGAGIIYDVLADDGDVIIKKCNNYGNIEGSSSVGGIGGCIARAKTFTVSECTNAGEIKASANTGGIIGYISDYVNEVNINNCTNEETGKIKSANSSAGILGMIDIKDKFEFENNTNNAEIFGDNSVGGIIGWIDSEEKADGKIENCTNSGNVNGNTLVGGIIGAYSGNLVEVKNCINKAEITVLEGDAGGIFGYLSGPNNYDDAKITECKNMGNIICGNKENPEKGGYCVGGIAGYCYSSTEFVRCTNSGNLTTFSASPSMGGIVGSGRMKNTGCSNSGTLNCPNVVDPDFDLSICVGDIIGDGTIEE